MTYKERRERASRERRDLRVPEHLPIVRVNARHTLEDMRLAKSLGITLDELIS